MTIISLVKNEGNSELLAWRYPSRQLPNNACLVVGAGETAVLIADRQPAKLYPAGRHTLATRHIPLLGAIMRLPFGGKSPYEDELWFVTAVERCRLRWGTDQPVQLIDDTSGLLLSLRGYGQFGIQIDDLSLFLSTICLNLSQIGERDLYHALKSPMRQAIRDNVAAMMRERGGIAGVEGCLGELSQCVLDSLAPEAARYGVRLTSFCIADLIPEPGDIGTEQLRKLLATRAAERRKPSSD